MSTEIATVKTALDRLNASTGKSSLDALVKARTRRSLMLVDCSGSMSDLTKTGERKIDALRKVVTELRTTHPVPMAAFGSRGRHVELVETIPEPSGMTPLDDAINFGREQGANHLLVITDGQPDSESRALDAAIAFGGVIDVFYIGDGHDSGSRFSAELAKRTGGSVNLTDLVEQKALAGKIAGLLGDGSSL
jgi:Mg-chelatase subunit ChlD